MDKFDIVIFGATSFVGKILTRYYLGKYPTKRQISWAIAGRSAQKLDELKESLGPVGRGIPTIIADANDEESLKDLCDQTSVIISTVGPYDLYGDNMVKACAETGTDYCDITGEARWMNRMRKLYQQTAEESGARIVHCCGFDSLPSDMGVWYLQQQAQEQLDSYCSTVKLRVLNAAGSFSGGTVATMINETTYLQNHPEEIKELTSPYVLCPEGYENSQKQHRIYEAEYDKDMKSWIMPFMMAPINEPVVFRSNALLNNRYGDNFRYNEAMVTGKDTKGKMAAKIGTAVTNFFTKATGNDTMRGLLEKYVLPKTGEGPSLKAQENGFYDIRLLGFTDDGKSIQVKVTGDRDPGYGSTAKMIGQCAICLLKDIPESEKSGGMWTTSTIFDERLIKRLTDDAGMTFELISE